MTLFVSFLSQVRAENGFLFDGYDEHNWYHEMIDMLHKLAMTSFVAFFPASIQLQVR